MNSRVVFLFGAGATLAWGSPLTRELTTLIVESGFRTVDNTTTITHYIYSKLKANGYEDWEVNFETIINVIEEMIVYYSYFNSDKKLPSLLEPFFSPQFENDIFNYSIEGGEARHGYKLQIPAHHENDFIKRSYHNEEPHQFFLQHLLANLITAINARISKYAYHTKGHSVIYNNKNGDINRSFTNWIKKLSSSTVLRLYTLNYDRLFKILLAREGLNIFEGFECDEYIETDAILKSDIRKILTDFDSHIHYNLHGSAFWRVRALDQYQLPNPEISLIAAPSLPINYEQSTLQIEKGKTIMLTNIITGYQKAQKSMIAPFRQMQSSFDKDCCFADVIYVVGFSFGDEHINSSLKLAIRHNPNVKIIIVDPAFIKNKMDEDLIIRLFPYRNDLDQMKPTYLKENVYTYFKGAITVYTLDFSKYLEQC